MEQLQTVLKSIDQVGARLKEVENKSAQNWNAIVDLSQKGTSFSGMPTVEKTKSFAELVLEAVEGNAEMIAKSGSVKLEIATKATKGAGATAISTGSAPVTVSGDVSQPAPYALGIQHAMVQAARANQAEHFIYSRFANAWDGDVAAVAELKTKPTVTPTFEKVTQDSITLSAITEISDQALFSAPELLRVIELVLQKSTAIQLDSVLAKGNVVAGTGQFEGLLSLAKAKTSTYLRLADAVQDAAADLQTLGLVPNAVVMNAKTWVATATLQDSYGRYLSGDYSTVMSMTLRNLPVFLSNSVADGKALVLDNRFVELGVLENSTITLGYINDSFARGARNIRIDTRISPAVYQTDSMVLVTPKAA